MINNDNLPDVLALMGFTRKGSIWTKMWGEIAVRVDMAKGEIRYPETSGMVVNERQTCNFSDGENFVVLECVCRLLDKGYKPEHIELEPKWKLGHGASGGRADIQIKNNHGKSLLIIECKTPGREFNKAWTDMKRDGGQLFSYAQQASETQFLCLYTSDFDSGALAYTSHVVAHRDNLDYLKDNPAFRSFKDATNVRERFAVWRETYKLDYTPSGIFEDGIQPYHIGKDKYSLADLHVVASVDQQKKYHEFATILRQHNVSGRENAFDKLVNLFLCKLVDEARNPNDLRFYWKGVAYDTHFDLLDRLQRLYQVGMKEFLGEEVTYIDRGAVLNAMRFIKQNPDATQNAVWSLFQQQKFFTNNDFSFIDVHNERLFYQNAEVLLKILQMWQGIKLTGNHADNQFLGDLFEGFLDQGVKQSEGQYFTPGPICRFIMMSLPLPSLLEKLPQPPRAIDYACGAGHFLTELASQLRDLLPSDASMADYYKAIYGIEKEYRLSKVAKVSAFMYGQSEINICYGDALVNRHAAFPDIRDGSFDVLVANPPYSVRGFLDTLPDEERKAYALAGTIKDAETANSIETFFVERAKQLLKAGGVAAIILPASFLSNGGGVYVRAREILIRHFDVVAIAEFGSGTFGKTGTNTVTLFLRRKQTTPEAAAHYLERVAEWFGEDDNQPVYKDEHLIAAYSAHIGVSVADYKTLLQGRPNAALRAHDIFAQYAKAFEAGSEVTALKKQKFFKALPEQAKAATVEVKFRAFVKAIEQDKLYHFVMAADQSHSVLLIKSPTETKAIRRFLGYGWSDAKGSEGIQPIKDAGGRLFTTLYDETDRRNADKLNRLITDNFDGVLTAIPAALSEFATLARLVELLDFSQTEFPKVLSLAVKTASPQWVSKWPMQRLGDLCSLRAGGTPARAESRYWGGKIRWLKINDYRDFQRITDTSERITDAGLKESTAKLLDAGTVVVSIFATIGRVGILKERMATNQAIVGLNPKDEGALMPVYLMQAVKYCVKSLEDQAAGLAQSNINQTKLADLKIPLPPMNVQRQIVTECEAVDAEVEKAQMGLADALKAIESKVEVIYASSAPRQTIASLALAVQYGLNEKMNEDGRGYRIFRMNEIVRGRMADKGSMKRADISAEEFAKYRLNRGDLLFNRTNSIEHVGKTGLFDLDGDYCFASYLVRIAPDPGKVLPMFLVRMMNSTGFQREAKGQASKAVNQANINAEKMKSIKVPVPPLATQKKFAIGVEALEQAIATAEAVIASAPARKKAILDKYL
jgi:type I restriction enzyme M protein